MGALSVQSLDDSRLWRLLLLLRRYCTSGLPDLDQPHARYAATYTPGTWASPIIPGKYRMWLSSRLTLDGMVWKLAMYTNTNFRSHACRVPAPHLSFPRQPTSMLRSLPRVSKLFTTTSARRYSRSASTELPLYHPSPSHRLDLDLVSRAGG